MANGSVTLEIGGGATTAVPWVQGMNVQQALESARSQTPDFTFHLQYFGSQYGYLVAMINETYDTFASSAEPFFYWELLVNGVPAQRGIDGTSLNSGDVVRFAYTQYIPEQHDGSLLSVKHEARRLT